MKNTKKIVTTLIVLLTFTLSCKDSFLDVKPTGSISAAQLTSLAGLQGLLIGAYSDLGGRSGGFYSGLDNWFWGSVLGGEATKGSNSGDQAQVNEIMTYNPQPSNSSIQEKYQNTYEGVARCNAVLREMPDADPTVSAADKTEITAEARFLRGLYYFELKKNFNNTPYVDETVDNGAGIEEVSNTADLWPMIEADLQFAVDNLPSVQTAAGRANKYAAEGFLAKAELFEGKFAAALALFNDMIANGVTSKGDKYGLLANYGDLFRAANDNNKEIVFSIQAAAGTGTVNNANPDFVLNFPYNGGPAGCCGFDQPTFELVNSFRTDAGGLPFLDGSYNTPAKAVKSDEGVSSGAPFTPDAGNLDPRLDWSVGRRGLPYLDHGLHPGQNWIRDQTYAGPYAPKKFVWSAAEKAAGQEDESGWTPGYPAMNFPLMRFADVLLMAAECEAQVGSLVNATNEVNMVRNRAKNGAWVDTYVDNANPSAGFTTTPAANYVINPYALFADKASAMKAIKMERKLEFSDEGHRFYDLVRWGDAATALNAFLSFEKTQTPAGPYIGATFTAGKSEYLPIPQSEIDILGSDVIHQNPGY